MNKISGNKDGIQNPMQRRYLNLACGNAFIESAEWINFDFTPSSSVVKKVNLLGPLPLPDASIDLIYCSHFVEHIPRSSIVAFLAECKRVLRSAGIFRIVVPDFENMCAEYLNRRHINDHDEADYMMIEILDQCVRKVPGGELAVLYAAIKACDDSKLKAFIHERVGEDFPIDSGVVSSGAKARTGHRSLSSRIQGRLERAYLSFLCRLLPAAFLRQNVSLARVGETHAWLYDFYSLRKMLLMSAGFQSVERMSFNRSLCASFPLYPLDMTQQGGPRKGLQSMYIEARMT